jgi:hypothetical protein
MPWVSVGGTKRLLNYDGSSLFPDGKSKDRQKLRQGLALFGALLRSEVIGQGWGGAETAEEVRGNPLPRGATVKPFWMDGSNP